jgi:hypothetical protein
MKEHKFSRSVNPFLPQYFRNITINASRGSLWARTVAGKPLETKESLMCPSLKVSPSLKTSLQQFVKDLSFNFDIERYIKVDIKPAPLLEIELREVKLFGQIEKRESLVRFVKGTKVENNEFETILQNVLGKIESFDQEELLDSYDLCVPVIQYQTTRNKLKLTAHMLFPSVSLVFQPIAPIKIVSTSLTQSLTERERFSYCFQTGFLSLDQKKRVFPIKTTDKQRIKSPLIGIWATGINGVINQSTLLWAACIRFIESQQIEGKISPNPSTNTFLLIYFAPRPTFFEVSTNGCSGWQIISQPLRFSASNVRFFEEESQELILRSSEKKSLTASTSSSEAKSSQMRSFENEATETMIIKHNLMLKSLEQQIKELQNVLSEPKFANAETNTTSHFQNEE